MPRHIDDVALGHLANLIDAVGKLIAPILYVHPCIGVAYVATVHVGNARHVFSLDQNDEPSGTKIAIPAGCSEELKTDTEKLLDLPYRLLQGEDDDAVLGFYAQSPARLDDGTVAKDRADAHALGQVLLAKRRPDQRRGLQRLRLDHLCHSPFYVVDGADAPATHVLQDTRDGHGARIDMGVDAERLGEVMVGWIVDQHEV